MSKARVPGLPPNFLASFWVVQSLTKRIISSCKPKLQRNDAFTIRTEMQPQEEKKLTEYKLLLCIIKCCWFSFSNLTFTNEMSMHLWISWTFYWTSHFCRLDPSVLACQNVQRQNKFSLFKKANRKVKKDTTREVRIN